MSTIYDWQRFWCSREDAVNMDGGFLYDPNTKWGTIYNPNVKPIEEFLTKPCLILLGEPGLGKSFEVERSRSLISGAGSINAEALFINLNVCKSDNQLEKKIVDNPIFKAWRISEQDILYLTLESLDECLIRVEILTNMLLEMLKESPIERLYLRIVCRTGYWPAALEAGLRKLWGQESIGIIELMPLRRIDVKSAAQMESVDFEAFMDQIESRDISSFAARPITLKFLLTRFKATEDFPDNQIEMYDEGCLMLCEEVNPLRANTSAAGKLTGKARLIIASRIAAALIFSGKTTIWTTLNDGAVPDEAITIEKLVGVEQMDGHLIIVDDCAILETLATGLFSARGQNILGWAHQTYGEYLAANYLRINSVDEKKIMSLISVVYGGGKNLIPQLFPVAAWIAGMLPSVFRQVMIREPEILLLGDIAATNDNLKAEFTNMYLKQLDNEAVIDWEMRPNFRYDRIKHAGLAEQIKYYIINKNKNETVRTEVIHIAKQCRLEELGGTLSSIALDEVEPIQVRIVAALAVAHIGKDEDKAKMKVLATKENNDDYYDQLKGYGLMAVWPNFITAEELFNSLTPPKRSSFTGSYSYFISEYLLPGLKKIDIPAALQWMLTKEMEEERLRSHGRFEELPDKILRLGWENFDEPGIIEKLAHVILRRIESYKGVLGEADGETTGFSEQDSSKRRRLVEYLIAHFSTSSDIAQTIASSNPALIWVDDVDWVIERLMLSIQQGAETKTAWAHILKTLWYWADRPPEITFKVYNIYQNNPELTDIFEESFSAMDLSLESTQEVKEWYYKRKKWEERESEEKHQESVDVAANVKEYVEKFENGQLDAWWRMCYALTFDETGTQKDEYLSDITACPGWAIIDTTIQAKIVDLAELYLCKQEPNLERWIKSDTLFRPDFAGFKAIRLLYSLLPEKLQSLPTIVWEKWAPVIVCYPEWADSGDDEIHKALVKEAYLKAASEVIKYVAILIERENNRSGYLNRLDKIEYIWDDNLATILFKKVKGKEIKPNALWYMLQRLSSLNYEPAFEYAKNVLKYRRTKERAIVFAEFIFHSSASFAWNLIWDIINRDVEFGKSLILNLASSWESVTAKVLPKLEEVQLENLYLWIVTHFPYEEDPKREGVYSPTARDRLTFLRSSVLEVLKGRGSEGAILSLARIVKELPEQRWLVVTLKRAQKVRRQKMWLPPKPEEILSLIKVSQSRLVQNGEHLLEVVYDALCRIQYKMQGETPIAFTLWDRVKDHSYRPKGENDFSDLVKVLLEYELVSRGIILNREVEIRRNRGGASGQRTDIHVEAIANTGTHDVVRVIIEAKGCWHDELNTAMATQLVGGYFKENECKHGIYLVGWFNCKQWDTADKKRRRQAFKHEYGSLVAHLEDQAKDLSANGILVKPFIVDVSLR